MKMTFQMGEIIITDNAMQTVNPRDILIALQRHSRCDWGDATENDKKINETALIKGCVRILSFYHETRGRGFWVITNAARRKTTVLLPEDYKKSMSR